MYRSLCFLCDGTIREKRGQNTKQKDAGTRIEHATTPQQAFLNVNDVSILPAEEVLTSKKPDNRRTDGHATD